MHAADYAVVLIGAGNVGYHLGRRLHEQGVRITQVFSRTMHKAQTLADAIEAEATDQLSSIRRDANLYILAVHDSAIVEVASQLTDIQALVVHTSGATPSTVLADYCARFGIFYPLQTFSISRPVNFSQIPICVHANNPADLQQLEALARSLSPLTYRIDDAQRAILHVAAVFVNNFANHLFHIGYDILQQAHLPFDLLRPLIQETVAKVQQQPPAAMQTGPAVRHDQVTIDQHLAYLQKYPDYRLLYEMLTQNIKKEHFTNGEEI